MNHEHRYGNFQSSGKEQRACIVCLQPEPEKSKVERIEEARERPSAGPFIKKDAAEDSEAEEED